MYIYIAEISVAKCFIKRHISVNRFSLFLDKYITWHLPCNCYKSPHHHSHSVPGDYHVVIIKMSEAQLKHCLYNSWVKTSKLRGLTITKSDCANFCCKNLKHWQLRYVIFLHYIKLKKICKHEYNCFPIHCFCT